jgi:hypothetical protein
MESFMELESSLGQMEVSTKENGKIAGNMDKGNS